MTINESSNLSNDPRVRIKDFLEFTGDVNGTVELEATKVLTLGEKTQLLGELFGSWVGDSDA